MVEHVDGNGLYVIRLYEVAIQKEGLRLGGADEVQHRPGAGAEHKALLVASQRDNVLDILDHAVAHLHLFHCFLHRKHVLRRADALDLSHGLSGQEVLGEAKLLRLLRIPQGKAHHKAIHLRLGQRIGSKEFHGILCRDDHKGLGQGIFLAVHRHLPFRHGLKKARLRLGGCAVDLVRQKDLVHDRALAIREFAGLHVIDRGAHHVSGKRVRRELDPSEITLHGVGKRSGKRCLSHAGHVLQEHVAACQQADQHVLRRAFLSHEIFHHLLFQKLCLLAFLSQCRDPLSSCSRPRVSRYGPVQHSFFILSSPAKGNNPFLGK